MQQMHKTMISAAVFTSQAVMAKLVDIIAKYRASNIDVIPINDLDNLIMEGMKEGMEQGAKFMERTKEKEND